MDDIAAFIANNVWLTLGVGAIIVIIGDEVLGVSRGLLGDDPPPRRRNDPPEADPLDDMSVESGEGDPVESLLPRRRGPED